VRSHKTLRFARAIRSFVSRHTRLLELLGLLVVFITFVIKDGIRDQLKDRVSTLAASEVSFLISSEISTVSHKIDELKPMGFIPTETGAVVPTGIGAIDEIKRLKDSVSVYTSRTGSLIDALPNNDALEKRMSGINKRAGDFDFEAATIEAKEGRGSPSTNGIVPLNTLLTLGKGQRIQSEIDEFQWEVFDAADKAAKAAEGRYKVATWTSWLFYGVGWFLTATARLLGVKGIEAGSD